MKISLIYTAAACICFALATGCSSDKQDETGPANAYDRDAMVAHYADNLLVPGYQALKTETAELHKAVGAFTANPSAATLTSAREAYQLANLAWQDMSVYEFGPAAEQMLRSNLNIYPTAPSEIESNIAAGTYSLSTTANTDTKGFPALDYLLYGGANETEVVKLYTSHANAAKRKKYLEDITQLLQQQTEATYTAWTQGNYAKTFKEAKGTAIGSATGNLVNELNSDIDVTKRYKVGLPAGKFDAGTPRPEKLEAPYSNLSLALLQRTIKAEKAAFSGTTPSGSNGPGLDDYLDHIGAKYTGDLLGNNFKGKPLSEAIAFQFDAVLAAAQAIQAPLSGAIRTNQQAVLAVYDEYQKLIVLTKTDMPSALGVTISYSDNDGD